LWTVPVSWVRWTKKHSPSASMALPDNGANT
jgi:hypothetical protein